MIQARTASILVIGAMAVVAIGGGVALASAGGDDTATPSRAAVADALTGDGGPTASPAATPGEGEPATTMAASPSEGGPSREGGSSREGGRSREGGPSTSPSAGRTPVGAAEARTIALRAAGGGRVTKVEPELEHGRAVWDIEVLGGGVEHDIEVDRATGDVVRHRTDGDEEGRDDRYRDVGGRDD